jgi:hypothetical protein
MPPKPCSDHAVSQRTARPRKPRVAGWLERASCRGSWLGHAFPISMFRLAADVCKPGATLDIDNSHRIIIRHQDTLWMFLARQHQHSQHWSLVFSLFSLAWAQYRKTPLAGPSGAEVLNESAIEGICLLYEESPIQGANWCLVKPRVQLQRHGLHLGSTTSPSFAIGCSHLQLGRR